MRIVACITFAALLIGNCALGEIGIVRGTVITRVRRHRIFSLLFILACAVLLATCDRPPPMPPEAHAAPAGIWLGEWQRHPLSMEFYPNGRMVLVSGGEDTIGFASYRLDFSTVPASLDITFDHRDHGTVRTLFEHVDEDTIRIANMQADVPRPAEFGVETIVLHHTEKHTHQR